jgi:hypothetical protein
MAFHFFALQKNFGFPNTLVTGEKTMVLRANVLAKIAEDHARIRTLLKQILEPSISDKKRKDLYGDLRRELTLHSMLEDEHLYPQLKKHADTVQWSRIAMVQHATQDRLITQLDKYPVGSPLWMKDMKQLQEEVLCHLGYEDIELSRLAKFAKAPSLPPKTAGRTLIAGRTTAMWPRRENRASI